MKFRYLAIAFAALLLSGCATYGYRGGSGDYYYGQSSGSGYYGAPYGSVGYGTYGGFRGNIGYGYPRGYYSRSYWPGRYYGYRYPGYGYYGSYYYNRPIVRPRPGHDRPPRESRPGAPWRNLQGVTRVEHRERPQRVQGRPSGIRTQQGQRERIQPSVRPPEAQRSRSSPWRAGSSNRQSSSRPARSTPAPTRQSSAPTRQRAAPAPARRSTPSRAGSRDSDRRRIQER